VKKLIGNPPINPWLFYSGKFSGYFCWAVVILSILNRPILPESDHGTAVTTAYFLFTIGFIIALISIAHLGSSVRLGTPTEATILKTGGIYKLSRNPMYVGFNLMTISSAVLTFEYIVLILCVFSLYSYHMIIIGEERFLFERFGDSFMLYKQKVRRYL